MAQVVDGGVLGVGGGLIVSNLRMYRERDSVWVNSNSRVNTLTVFIISYLCIGRYGLI